MNRAVAPGSGRLAGQAGSAHPTPSGVLWMAGMGGLAGLLHAHGATLTHACTAVAVGAALATVVALRAETVAGWWSVMATAFVIALSMFSRTDWALARHEPLRQRCLFVLAIVAVGVRLWIMRADTGPVRQGDPGRAERA